MAKESFTDNKRVRDLIKLMTDHGLTEVELVEDKAKIRLKRDFPPAAGTASAGPVVHQVVSPVAGAGGGGANPAVAAEEDDLVAIKSPMVGTFYSAPNPESEAYVRVGAAISPKTVVCVIEAMKVFNEIHADVGGTVIKMLVANGQAVEFNQPLFLVRPD